MPCVPVLPTFTFSPPSAAKTRKGKKKKKRDLVSLTKYHTALLLKYGGGLPSFSYSFWLTNSVMYCTAGD